MGISATLAAVANAIAAPATAALTGLGVGGTTAGLIGTGLGDAVLGAGLGAGTAGLTGGDPGAGALGGALSFGLGGVGGGLAPELGLSEGAGGALGGALGGLGASALSGGSPLTGALTGALGGYGATALNPAGGIGAAGTAAPAGAGSAAGSSLSAAGGGLPAGSIGADLTTGALPTEVATVSAPSLGAGGGALAGIGGFAAGGGTYGGTGGGGAGGHEQLGGGLPGVTAPTISPSVGDISAGALPALPDSASPGLGFLGKDSGILGLTNGQLGQGALLGLQGVQQKQELNKLLAPLTSSANNLKNTSAALEGGLFGGQLPAGARAAVDQATTAAKARVRSTYANLGLSGSTMEADALNQVDREAATQTFGIANNLFQEGMKGTAMSNDLYSGILSTQLSQDKALSDAIAGFAAQMMGAELPSAGKSITLNLGGV